MIGGGLGCAACGLLDSESSSSGPRAEARGEPEALALPPNVAFALLAVLYIFTGCCQSVGWPANVVRSNHLQLKSHRTAAVLLKTLTKFDRRLWAGGSTRPAGVACLVFGMRTRPSGTSQGLFTSNLSLRVMAGPFSN